MGAAEKRKQLHCALQVMASGWCRLLLVLLFFITCVLARGGGRSSGGYSSSSGRSYHQVGSGQASICKTERKISSPCTSLSPPPPRGWVVSAQIRQEIQGEEGWLTYWAPGRSMETSNRPWSNLRSIIGMDTVWIMRE